MFDDFHSTVLEFMQESGNTATLIKETLGEYDPATGETPSVLSEIPVEVIVMDLTLQSNGLSSKYNTLVEAGDKEAFVRPNATTPFVISKDDRLLVGSTTYKVVTLKEINPTGEDLILYSLYLRR